VPRRTLALLGHAASTSAARRLVTNEPFEAIERIKQKAHGDKAQSLIVHAIICVSHSENDHGS
jgi:hypothetical protein